MRINIGGAIRALFCSKPVPVQDDFRYLLSNLHWLDENDQRFVLETQSLVNAKRILNVQQQRELAKLAGNIQISMAW